MPTVIYDINNKYKLVCDSLSELQKFLILKFLFS